MNEKFKNLPYNPEKLPRELTRHYISITDQEQKEMLTSLGKKDIKDLFAHIPNDVKFDQTPQICEELNYTQLLDQMRTLANKNKPKTSFIGDGLKDFKVNPMVPFVSDIRGLTTAYTPYQPERCQGTLMSLWLYTSSMSMLTGFEAINASMYDRSTCLFEALNAAVKSVKNSNTVLVCESIYPDDMNVIRSLAAHTALKIISVPLDKKTGLTNIDELKRLVSSTENLAGIAFPQVNSLGNLEDVHTLTDICSENKLQSIAIIDPMLLATGGLVPPAQYGSQKQGTNMIVAEGQHLTIGPSFGGPGLGIFGVRYNETDKNSIRNTAGRYIGRAQDSKGRECLSMILSTREQHIRREKASSNICSNQSFMATLAGASILGRGENGMKDSCQKAFNNAQKMANELTKYKGVKLAYKQTPFYNEVTLELPVSAKELIQKARNNDLHLGVDVSSRTGNPNHILISFSDKHENGDLEKLNKFFAAQFGSIQCEGATLPQVPSKYLRSDKVGLPNFSHKELQDYYTKLGDLNVSPDHNIYPLGSCTMKYNPYINDYAAGLAGFHDIHPQAPIEDAQGSLQVQYELQEMFKKMTGLAAVTLQPLAGAQGELAGLKMFQAYHADRGQAEQRNIILIPHSAHGTNPATATMAGFENKKVGGVQYGIVLLEANAQGQIDMEQLKKVVDEYNTRIAGVMVTNPNTSGIFESNFKKMSEMIHNVGGLVYMDGANMNAIAGILDLNKLGVDAVHNNLHKTWSISHGGGGPGAALVAVSSKLADYLPGHVVVKSGSEFKFEKTKKSIGMFHRHHGNFAHLVRCYAYLRALGSEGVVHMSQTAVLSAQYLFNKVRSTYPTLPAGTADVPRMHEFILTISPETFKKLADNGTKQADAIVRIGKLFLDFGLHAPTVAFPEVYGLMVEPTESYSKSELDRFCEVILAINNIVQETPEVLTTVPHFTPVSKVDEVNANKNVVLSEKITALPKVHDNIIHPGKLAQMKINDIIKEIVNAHKKAIA